MRNIFIYIAMGIIALQAGCSVVQIEHEESSIPCGSSVKLAVQQQTLNPEAGSDAPVVGLDGRYAAKVAEKYNEGPRTESQDGQSVSEIVIGAK